MTGSPDPLAAWRGWGTRPLLGTFDAPGDKSISHRALMLNALAEGRALVQNANPGRDVASTMRCLSRLGVGIVCESPRRFEIRGRGRHWRPAPSALDCGNSGTTARLLAGILAGQSFTVTLDGDESLRQRPMARVARPLRAHGARVEGPDNGEHLPLIVTGPLREGGVFRSAVASAQVKSALLLAALVSDVDLRVEEPAPSRNHTELLLEAMGASIEHGPGWARLHRGSNLAALDLNVAADPSAAAFTLGAAALLPESAVRARRVLLNPTRSGFVRVLQRMGVPLTLENPSREAGEDLADLCVAHGSELRGCAVTASEIPSLIDEVPLLAVVAAFAEGATCFEGIGELRVKESDRVVEITRLLAAWGITVEVDHDRMTVRGGRPRTPASTFVVGDDHRLAMAAAVLALGSAAREHRQRSLPLDMRIAGISDPDFVDTWEGLQGGT